MVTSFNWFGFGEDYFQFGDGSIVASINNLEAPFQITAIAQNGCGSNTGTLLVNPAPPKTGLIVGSTNICPGASNVMYAVYADHSGPQQPTYEWILPSGASIDSGLGTHSITVSFSSTIPSNKNIKVREINTCGLKGPWRSMHLNISSANCRLSGTRDTNESTLNVYPNPAKDIINIDLMIASDEK